MPTQRPSSPLVSVIIVNYKVPHFVKQAVLSLRDADLYEQAEVLVVDNASGDDSKALITQAFPEVIWIGLKSNFGFGKACNVAARKARGRYLLLLNPDTVVSRNSISSCVQMMEANERIGLLGPKILNPDGTLQHSCRRSFPTPMVALYHFCGLARLFPRSKRFGRYNLTFMDADAPARVDAVSGSFMFITRALYRMIGGFDEAFFMYGEDLDLCRQVYERGYEVWYNSDTQIIHYKGRSSSQRSLRSRLAFYDAMLIFSRKYRHLREAFLPSWLIFIGILIQASVHISVNLFRSLRACFIDMGLINLMLWGSMVLRFELKGMPNPYGAGGVNQMVMMHLLLSVAFVWSFVYRGVYTQGRYSVRNTLVSGLLASTLFMTCIYFIQSIAFSRVGFGFAALGSTLLLAGWRLLLQRMVGSIRRLVASTGSVVVVGDGLAAQQLIHNVESDPTALIEGVVWPEGAECPGVFEGYPVLGSLEDLPQLLGRRRVDMVLIATTHPWYSHVIEALASRQISKMVVRWVPDDILTCPEQSLPQKIPLHDFTV